MWDPSVNSSKVKVTANDGIITLRGSVPHFIEKMSAEHAAQRVGGVKAVADELEVKGNFDCVCNHLINLKFSPGVVGENFTCCSNFNLDI